MLFGKGKLYTFSKLHVDKCDDDSNAMFRPKVLSGTNSYCFENVMLTRTCLLHKKLIETVTSNFFVIKRLLDLLITVFLLV